jgi:acetyltransferase-like isoleucine patch superfamily enzyme
MKDLIILTADPHAFEMADIVERINQDKKTWNIIGYVLYTQDEADKYTELNSYPVLGTFGAFDKYPQAAILPRESGPIKGVTIPRERLATIVDPSSFVARTASIGAGCVIFPNCFIGRGAKLGDWVFSLSGSIINHDCVLEDCVTLCSGVTLAGAVHVEDHCYLGQGCNIKQYLKIGRNSLIGMGAVVVKEVPPNAVMAGNPARKMRERIGYER